jgi:hypothetical protein
MSRLDGRPAQVICDAAGQPRAFTLPGEKRPVPIFAVLDHWREWIGALQGEPPRDVWQVETPRGLCELHHLSHPTEDEDVAEDEDEPAGDADGSSHGDWLLFRWED